MKKIDYQKFKLRFLAGKKVYHLSGGWGSGSLCGVNMLPLVCNPKKDDRICKNCKKAVTIIKVRRRRVAIYKGFSNLEARVEEK